MLVFIDDSGDPGFKIGRGSTSHFVIAMVVFKDNLEAEKTAIAIKQLKKEIGFSDRTEFRFFKTKKIYRIKFLEVVSVFDFEIRALIVDKKIIYSQELKNNTNSFYAYFIKEVLKHSNLNEANIKLDGSGNRIFRKSFSTYLRKELNNKDKNIIKNCKMVDSKNNVLIQLADMVAGSIHRYQNKDKKDCDIYKEIIKNNIKNEWPFR